MQRLIDIYTDVLWRSMDALGVSQSVERKIAAAVGIQFAVSVAQAALPFVVAGQLRVLLSAALFVGAAIAFVNTILIARHDLVDPLVELADRSESIAAGTLDGDASRLDQDDEIGSLADSFCEMQSYLTVVSEQAAALSRQDFDDPILDEEVPGEFGASLRRMSENLEAYTTSLRELVDAFGAAAEDAKDGDLTAYIDPEGWEDDRYAEVIDNYNELINTLSATVGEVQSFAGDVAELSDDAMDHTAEVDRASEEVAASIQEISDGAVQQTTTLQTVADEMNTLSATVQEIAASADEVAETAATAEERGRSGRDAAADAIAELDEVEATIDETAAAVERLVDRIEEIDDIVSVINRIAEETNLLALNASIEAAHAGEAGDGFAVVADEVKSLAEETSESADEVSTLIGEIQAQSTSTVEDVRQMNDQVSDGIETVESTLQEFENIVDVIGQVNASIQEISTATDQQAETSQDIVMRVDDVASISEETAAESDSVATTAEQQSLSIGELREEVTDVSEHATELDALLSTFDVGENEAGGFDFDAVESTGGAEALAAPTDD